MIRTEIPECVEIYKKYEDLLINQSFSKAARVNNMRALLSLGGLHNQKKYRGRQFQRNRLTRLFHT